MWVLKVSGGGTDVGAFTFDTAANARTVSVSSSDITQIGTYTVAFSAMQYADTTKNTTETVTFVL